MTSSVSSSPFPLVEVKPSNIPGSGFGLFASARNKVIPAGTTLTQYPGQIISMEQFFYLDAAHHPAVHYTLFRPQRGILVVLKDYAENEAVDLSSCGHKVNDALCTIGPHLGAVLKDLEVSIKSDEATAQSDGDQLASLTDEQIQQVEVEFSELLLQYQQKQLELEMEGQQLMFEGSEGEQEATPLPLWNVEVEDIPPPQTHNATGEGGSSQWQTVMKTTRDVNPGEELFFSYGLKYWASRSYSPLYWSPRASTTHKKLAWRLRKITAMAVRSSTSSGQGPASSTSDDDCSLPALPRRVGLMYAPSSSVSSLSADNNNNKPDLNEVVDNSSSSSSIQLLVDLDMAPDCREAFSGHGAGSDTETVLIASANDNKHNDNIIVGGRNDQQQMQQLALQDFYQRLKASTIRDVDLPLVIMDLFGRSPQMMRLQKLPAVSQRHLVVAYLKKAAVAASSGVE